MITLDLPFMLDELARQEMVVGGFLLSVGLLYLLMGLRLSRMLVALSFGVIGFVLGACLPGPDEARIAIGMIAAVGMAGASLWAVRAGVSVLAGLWAAVITALLVGKLGVDGQIALISGGVVFFAAASLAFVARDEIIALVTSLEGTLLFLGGLIILANQTPVLWNHLRNLFVSHSTFPAFLVLSGTVVGFYTQTAELQKKQCGRSA